MRFPPLAVLALLLASTLPAHAQPPAARAPGTAVLDAASLGRLALARHAMARLDSARLRADWTTAGRYLCADTRAVPTRGVPLGRDTFLALIARGALLYVMVDVWDGDAILMAQRLSHELGLTFGISSGANLLGAIEIALEQGRDAVVATVFADCNRKYLSGALGGIEPVRPEYVTPGVELRGFERVQA